MAGSLNDVIKKLEQQRVAIERALSALREIEGPGSDSAASAPRGRRAKRKGGMTPEGRRRLSEAMKARWAAKRGRPAPVSRSKRKGGITAAGRKRLSEALKARWAAKRAASAGTKKAAGRKAAA